MTVRAVSPENGRSGVAGRVIAGATFVLTAYGVVALTLMGRSDHFPLGVAMFAVFAAGFGALTWLAFPRQPGNRALWVPAWASFLSGLGVAGWATTVMIGSGAGLDTSASSFAELTAADLPIAGVVSWELVNVAAASGMALMTTLWPLLFPDGRLPSPRWRWVAWGTVVNIIALAAVLGWVNRSGSNAALQQVPEDAIGTVVAILYDLLLVWALASVASLFRRQRRSTGEVRQQYRWVTMGTLLLLGAVLVVDAQPWALTAALTLVLLSVASYAVAVTKHGLYDIDVFISRTLVCGILAAFIGMVYVLVVAVVGGVFESGGGSLALAVVATALVAMAFEPLRRRAQRWANRLVYGKRATPYEVLADLTRRLARAEPAQGVLERMARLMAEGTGATQATVWLTDDQRGLTAAAGWPAVPARSQVETMDELAGALASVTHDGQPVGVLQVVKSRGNPVTPPEQHLIDDLAGSAGLVLGNQRLNAALAARADELQQSRRRLVDMQDSERRRLERDLHDGAQQQVIAVKLKIGLAEHVARQEGRLDLAGQLGELSDETQAAVDELRTLAKGIYPPLLESENLVAAIRAQAASAPVPVEVSSNKVGPYPRDVESAAYFAAVEAMTNAIAHGKATHVAITIDGNPGGLSVEVRDDGIGFDRAEVEPGVGLLNVRDRVEALGGDLAVSSVEGVGTTLSVMIPLDDSATATGAGPNVRSAEDGLA
jgi:signal transduction histidine kinase